MKPEIYQEKSKQFAIYSKEVEEEYLQLGLIAEIGEVIGVRAKHLRDGTSYEHYRAALLKEIGDCFWFLSQIHTMLGTELKESIIAYTNDEHEALLTLQDWGGDIRNTVDLELDLAALMFNHDMTIEEVLLTNYEKLKDRKARNVISGSGDNR